MNGRYLTLAGRIRQEIVELEQIPGIRPAVLSEENKIRLMNFAASAMLCVTYIAIMWLPFASAYWSQN